MPKVETTTNQKLWHIPCKIVLMYFKGNKRAVGRKYGPRRWKGWRRIDFDNLACRCRSLDVSFRSLGSCLFLSVCDYACGVSAEGFGSAVTDDPEDLESASSASKHCERPFILELTLILCSPRGRSRLGWKELWSRRSWYLWAGRGWSFREKYEAFGEEVRT